MAPDESGKFSLESFKQELDALITRYKKLLFANRLTDEDEEELGELKMKMIVHYASQKVPVELYDPFVSSTFILLKTIIDESSADEELTAYYSVEEIY